MRDFELQFSDKLITPWCGITLVKRMLDHIGFDRALSQAGLPQPGSHRGYRPEQLIMQMMLSMWCGGNRFEHAEVTRFDRVLGSIFDIDRMANFKAITRLFGKCTQAVNDRGLGSLYRWLFEQLHIGRVTLDLDSAVITRFGEQQQGAARGYNPAKPGRRSHHPLMAFISDVRMIANVWLRPGNTGSANNVIGFLQATREHLAGKAIGLLRADFGFCEDVFLRHLKGERINYIIALKLNQPLQRALVRATQVAQDTRATQAAQPPLGWWALDEGLEIADLMSRAPNWQFPRRIIAVRQHIKQRTNAKGKTPSLFAEDEAIGQWRYPAMVTDLNLPALQIWRMYGGRADCENRIKELKYGLKAGSLNLRDFWATEAALHTVMMAFNLMSLFRQVRLKQTLRKDGSDKPIQPTLSTLHYQLFAQPGFITHEGRRPLLKLATAMQKREWISGLWDQSRQFDLPVHFTTQFTKSDTSS